MFQSCVKHLEIGVCWGVFFTFDLFRVGTVDTSSLHVGMRSPLPVTVGNKALGWDPSTQNVMLAKVEVSFYV